VLRPLNFISLSMAAGFFIGLMFAILNFSEPLDIILVTLLVNFLFFIVVTFGMSLYLQTYESHEKLFQRGHFEQHATIIAEKINNYEARIELELEAINRVRQAIG
jgi:hypothetical protein